MSKAKLVNELTEGHDPLFGTQTEATQATDAVVSGIRRLTERGERVELRGFGTFEVKTGAERRVKNPRTGEPMRIAPKPRLKFRDLRK